MSDDLIKRLSERRMNAWEHAKGILDNAEAEGRAALDAEEEAAWQAANADIDTLDERIKSLVDAEQRSAEMAAAFASIDRAPQAHESSVTDQFRALQQREVNAFEVAHRDLSAHIAQRDLTKGTATAGGNTVPTGFAGMLWEHLVEVSTIAGISTVWNTPGGETIDVPVTTTHATGALISEGSTLTESDAAFAKRSLGAYKYAYSFQVSRELMDDTGIDLSGYFARAAGRALGNAFGADLAVGNGSSKPSGVVQTSTLGVTGAAAVAGVPTAENLIDLYYSVIAPYRNSDKCAWMMRDSTAAQVRKLREGSGTGNFLWTPGLGVAPDTILGKPVVIEPNIAAVAAGAKSIVFGDFAAYFVRVAGGIRFERSDEFAFQNDLVTFRAILRGDGVLGDQSGAVKHYIGGAAS